METLKVLDRKSAKSSHRVKQIQQTIKEREGLKVQRGRQECTGATGDPLSNPDQNSNHTPDSYSGARGIRTTIGSGMFYSCCRSRSKTTSRMQFSDPLLVGIDEIHKRGYVIPVPKTGLFLSHLEPGLHCGIVLGRVVQHFLAVRGFFGFAFVDVL